MPATTYRDRRLCPGRSHHQGCQGQPGHLLHRRRPVPGRGAAQPDRACLPRGPVGFLAARWPPAEQDRHHRRRVGHGPGAAGRGLQRRLRGGAKYVNPDINVISTYHPGEISQAFVDPEWGAATAKQALDQGADVSSAPAARRATARCRKWPRPPGAGTDLFCIGVDTDQWETLPAAHPCLVSSAMKLITPSVADLISSLCQGRHHDQRQLLRRRGLAPFHDFEDKVPQEVKDKLAEIDAGLKDGSLTTGYQPVRYGTLNTVQREAGHVLPPVFYPTSGRLVRPFLSAPSEPLL